MLMIYFSHYRIDGAGDTSKDEVDSGDELEQTRFERDEVRKVEEQKNSPCDGHDLVSVILFEDFYTSI